MSNETITKANEIKSILEKNYGPDEEGFYPVNEKLSAELATLLAKEETENLHRKVSNIVWDNYAGGDLAEKTATEILAII